MIRELAVTDFTVEDDGEVSLIEIRLNPVLRFEPKIYKMALLHECAHVHLYPYRFHGKRFDLEMSRLALIGAFNGIW